MALRAFGSIDSLGAKTLAHHAFDGSYNFPVADLEEHAIPAVNQARPAERESIRRFLLRRAKDLKAGHLIPVTWTALGRVEKNAVRSIATGSAPRATHERSSGCWSLSAS